MSAEKRSDKMPALNAGAQCDAGPSRRLMLRRSLGMAAPVVATMASFPVSAGTCVVASSYVSAVTFASRNPTTSTRYACTMTSRSGFLNDQSLTSFLNSTTFGSVFTPVPSTGLSFSASTKLKDMLLLTTVGGESEVAWRLVWLYMNLRLAAKGDLGTAYAQSIWTSYKLNGNSYVAPGVAWNSAQLITYLTFVLGA
jgi:hypothetical protein